MDSRLEYLLYAKMQQHQQRIKTARQSIKKAIATGRKFYASVSFGKDSAVMLRLLCDIQPNITVLYIKSGYALPETTRYLEELRQAWNLNLTVLDVPIDYLELCQTFGLPHLRSKATQKRVVAMIKKDHASQWAQEQSFTGLFWGLRADESQGRKKLMQCHPEGVIDRHNILRVAPLAFWTAQDVWAYTLSTGMPYNRLYDHENCGFTRETLRNTGWLSTDGETQGQLEWIRRNYPEQFQKVRELL
jgi:phosphoadenosine phosphosulfate reductase